jgi:UDP-N-acetylmuramate--alanine ligase
MHFTVERRTVRRHGNKPGPLNVTLNLPGLHNVRNALAAIGIATELGVGDEAITKALSEFSGVGRRFQRYGEISLASGGSFTLIDDYGHHPVEMAATLEAARGAFPDRRLVLAFQPHRFTRTRDCFGEFVQVLRNFDALVLTEVYPAGEAKIPGADGKSLMKAALAEEKNTKGSLNSAAVVFAANIAEMPEKLSQVLKDGDVLITMGAGSISALPHTLAEAKSV